jgi:hypothetical protein
MLVRMSALSKIVSWFKPKVKTPEEVEAAQEADRIRYEMGTIRLSQRSMAARTTSRNAAPATDRSGRERYGSRSGERLPQPGEHRQVGV